MTLFWILAAAMVIVAIGLLVPPLFGRRALKDQDRRAQNVAIARERLKELEAEHAGGNLDDKALEQARRELEEALADDVSGEGDATAAAPQRSPGMLAIIAVLVPLLAVGLYLKLGNPDGLNPEAAAAESLMPAHDGQQMSLPEMAKRLETKLEAQPDNAQGWYLLGRTYLQMRRFADAARAFEKLHALVGDEPGVLLPWADAIAMQQGGKVTGKAFELVQRVLEINPHEPTALWLAGMAYEQAGDHEQAVRHWKRLLPQLANDPESKQEVEALIARAEKALGRSVAVPAAPQGKSADGGARLTVIVDLDPALKNRVEPDDTVFVFARALAGPPMPLAVVRKSARDLPLTVVLDDSLAMMPQMKLSAFKEVRIEARVSKSGNALPQSGDLKGEITPVKSDRREPVTIRIDQVVP